MTNSSHPLISVVVPCYDVEAYLPRCIESIQNQTYRNLEIILVDDGSPDKCGQICDEYAAADNRIIVIHKKNGGVSDARNAALDIARGEYITCIDSDDSVAADYVETLYLLTQRYHSKMAICGWCFVSEEEAYRKMKETVSDFLLSKEDALSDMFNQVHTDVSPWGKLYHHSLFKDVRYPVGVVFEDLMTTFKLMLQCDEGVAFTTKTIYYYLLRNNSIEGKPFSEEKMNSAIAVFNMMKSFEPELKFVEQALENKLTSFCFHLILKMPKGYSEGAILYEYIYRNRWKCMMDGSARLKLRLACLSTYLGISTTKLLFRLIDKRNG